MAFRGRFVHTIDTKNRMSLPAGFRSEIRGESDEPPILTNANRCLDLYRNEDWLRFEESISEIASVDPEAQDYARLMISGAMECPIDKQGRILVPPHLREYAGLTRDVTIAGVGSKIEIWDRARFEETLTQSNARYPEMARSVAQKLGM